MSLLVVIYLKIQVKKSGQNRIWTKSGVDKIEGLLYNNIVVLRVDIGKSLLFALLAFFLSSSLDVLEGIFNQSFPYTVEAFYV